jgi:outer membrane receptor protein involved in Fe transport
VEWNNRWLPHPNVVIDADFALNNARYLNGDYVVNSVDRVATLSATLRKFRGWTATVAQRYIGPGALVEDNSVRSRSSIQTNLKLSYAYNKHLEFGFDVYNLLNRKNNDIQYFYESQLKGEAAPVADRHVHPADPRTIRFNVRFTY